MRVWPGRIRTGGRCPPPSPRRWRSPVKYQGYIDRQLRQVAEQRKMENRPLPPDLDYLSLRGLRTEARQKLDKIRPLNLGQASRISGVSPADIAALMIHLERPQGGEGAGPCPAKSQEKETL